MYPIEITYVYELNSYVSELNSYVSELNSYVSELNPYVSELNPYVSELNFCRLRMWPSATFFIRSLLVGVLCCRLVALLSSD